MARVPHPGPSAAPPYPQAVPTLLAPCCRGKGTPEASRRAAHGLPRPSAPLDSPGDRALGRGWDREETRGRSKKAEARDRGTEAEGEGSKGGSGSGRALELRPWRSGLGALDFSPPSSGFPTCKNGLKVNPFLFLRWS